jgi:hypothetical protein
MFNNATYVRLYKVIKLLPCVSFNIKEPFKKFKIKLADTCEIYKDFNLLCGERLWGNSTCLHLQRSHIMKASI